MTDAHEFTQVGLDAVRNDAVSDPSRTSASATLGLYSLASLGKRSWRMRAQVCARSVLDRSSR